MEYGKCEVHFLFRNASQHPVSVKVAFPIKIIIPLKETNEYDPCRNLLKNIEVKEGVSRKLISWKRFEAINDIGVSYIIADFAISQDGREINIDSVLVETQKAERDTAVIQFHFLHQLDFQPDDYSNVLVKFSLPPLSRENAPLSDVPSAEEPLSIP